MTHAYAYSEIASGQTPLSASVGYIKNCLKNFSTPVQPKSLPRHDIYTQLKNSYAKELEQKIFVFSEDFINKIHSLYSRQENWDGNGSEKPKSESIEHAKKWGAQICAWIINNDYEWRIPFISSDEQGDVVLEWWYQDRNLTLDISGNEVAFSEVRQADSSPHITNGMLKHSDIAPKLTWLIRGT